MGYVKKEDLVAELRSLGQTVDPSLTVPELRVWLQDLRGSKMYQKKDSIVHGISSMNKEELKKHCAKHGVEVGSNDTKDRLIVKLRNKEAEGRQATDNDLLGFGKHKDLSYKDVLQNYPNYVQWVLDTYAEEKEASQQLKKFALYIKASEGPISKIEVKRDAAASSSTKGEVKANIKKEQENDVKYPGTEADSRIDRLESAVAALLARITPHEWKWGFH